MKKSDELRVKTRKMIAKNLIILVALAVVAFVGAFSWFSHTTTANAAGLTASTNVSEALEYFIVEPKNNANGTPIDQYDAINTWIANYNTNHASDPGHVDKAWHIGEFTFDVAAQDLDPEVSFLDDLYMTDVTSNGIIFKAPKIRQMDEVAYVDTAQNFDEAVANENYLSFDIYFRAPTEHTVALMSSSKIEPLVDLQDIDNRNDEDEMKHAAIGAARMSVLDIGSSNERELLWIPGPGVWYDGLTKNTTTNERGVLHFYFDADWASLANRGHSVTYNGTSMVYSPAAEDTSEHVYYSDSGASKQRVKLGADDGVVASTDYENHPYELGTDKSVVTLSKTNGDYHYGYVRVNLWIEGEDAEARVKFVNGQFKMNLDFDIKDN